MLKNPNQLFDAIYQRDNAFVAQFSGEYYRVFSLAPPFIGLCPSEAAVACRNLEALQFFVSREAGLLTKSKIKIASPFSGRAITIPEGQDALHLAIWRNYSEITEFIIEKCAGKLLQQRNAEGETHLDLAVLHQENDDLIVKNLNFFESEFLLSTGSPNAIFTLIQQDRVQYLQQLELSIYQEHKNSFYYCFFDVFKEKAIYAFAKTAKAKEYLNKHLRTFYLRIQHIKQYEAELNLFREKCKKFALDDDAKPCGEQHAKEEDVEEKSDEQ